MRAVLLWGLLFGVFSPSVAGAAQALDVATPPESATEAVPPADAETARGPLVAVAELGSLAVISHRIQFGRNATYFDYRADGGQDTLYFNVKLALDLALSEKHHVLALYQPLELLTEERLDRDLVTDEVVFPAGTPMRFTYGFPFYRVSYLYDLVENRQARFALGGSLQIRNATIGFASLDGTLSRTRRDVGPVPLLKAVYERRLSERWWYGIEADGIYAPISYLNGSDTEVKGALIDANLRVGRPFHETADIYLNLRYLAGGAVGASNDKRGPNDGYVRNWLQFGIVAIGFRLNPSL